MKDVLSVSAKTVGSIKYPCFGQLRSQFNSSYNDVTRLFTHSLPPGQHFSVIVFLGRRYNTHDAIVLGFVHDWSYLGTGRLRVTENLLLFLETLHVSCYEFVVNPGLHKDSGRCEADLTRVGDECVDSPSFFVSWACCCYRSNVLTI
jgi:hypothetical protein